MKIISIISLVTLINFFTTHAWVISAEQEAFNRAKSCIKNRVKDRQDKAFIKKSYKNLLLCAAAFSTTPESRTSYDTVEQELAQYLLELTVVRRINKKYAVKCCYKRDKDQWTIIKGAPKKGAFVDYKTIFDAARFELTYERSKKRA